MTKLILFFVITTSSYLAAQIDPAPIKGSFHFNAKHNSTALPSEQDAFNKELQKLGHEMMMKIADLMIKNQAILAMNGKEPIMQYNCIWRNSQPSE